MKIQKDAKFSKNSIAFQIEWKFWNFVSHKFLTATILRKGHTLNMNLFEGHGELEYFNKFLILFKIWRELMSQK